MRYISTRGQSPALRFHEAALTGLAPDGGLYVPEAVPVCDAEFFRKLQGATFAETAFAVIRLFTAGDIPDEELKAMIDASYASFTHPAICPLKQLDDDVWMQELFHGPTFAFKDVALQFLGRVLDYFLTKQDKRVVIIGATSGDTGSAAIEGCKHSARVDTVILHPAGRVSDVQRRQMTTVDAPNVFNLAVEGAFDDCQDIVKALLKEQPEIMPGEAIRFAAVNSINWCRILAQITYYVYAAVRFGAPERAVAFSVPTGNFGDIYAGYVAKCMGLPVAKLIIATNGNDILHRFIGANDYSVKAVERTLSPSMDISIASNFERFLYNLHDGDADRVRSMMETFRENGLSVSEERLARARDMFASARCDDEATLRVMREIAARTGEYIDPHTATGVHAAYEAKARCAGAPVVVLATAHRAKFPEACAAAGYPVSLAVPEKLRRVMTLPERCDAIRPEKEAALAYIRKAVSARRAA